MTTQSRNSNSEDILSQVPADSDQVSNKTDDVATKDSGPNVEDPVDSDEVVVIGESPGLPRTHNNEAPMFPVCSGFTTQMNFQYGQAHSNRFMNPHQQHQLFQQQFALQQQQQAVMQTTAGIRPFVTSRSGLPSQGQSLTPQAAMASAALLFSQQHQQQQGTYDWAMQRKLWMVDKSDGSKRLFKPGHIEHGGKM
ncbi:unnamed protein product [Protopolystoma xenopodis]|uniref:Uncharacterized protein n=1 Tax=Protopolystoma xenopodis TaxID=117903 RepID=A0A448XFP3_9PLAT|nr:unnamed protein product [Protopolystoma xenopodis]